MDCVLLCLPCLLTHTLNPFFFCGCAHIESGEGRLNNNTYPCNHVAKESDDPADRKSCLFMAYPHTLPHRSRRDARASPKCGVCLEWLWLLGRSIILFGRSFPRLCVCFHPLTNTHTHTTHKCSPLQNQIFRLLQSKARVQIMLYEQVHVRIEGVIIGFDEYMNVVMDNAEELDLKKKKSKALGMC